MKAKNFGKKGGGFLGEGREGRGRGVLVFLVFSYWKMEFFFFFSKRRIVGGFFTFAPGLLGGGFFFSSLHGYGQGCTGNIQSLVYMSNGLL